MACDIHKTDRNIKSIIDIKQNIEQSIESKEYKEIREKYTDLEDSFPELKLTDEQLNNIKESGVFGGNKCFTCLEYTGDDPNMKYQGIK